MKIFESIKQRWLVWVWKHTPTCAEMSRLASRRLDESLPLQTRWKMRLHFLICVWCHRYFKQLHALHQAAPRLDETSGPAGAPSLSGDARRRIKVRLTQADRK